MALGTVIKGFIPLRQGQKQGRETAPAIPQGIYPAVAPSLATAPAMAPASVPTQATPPSLMVAQALALAAPAPEPTPPAPTGETKKVDNNIMNLFLQAEVEASPFQALTGQLSEVDISGLHSSCLEVKEKLDRLQW